LGVGVNWLWGGAVCGGAGDTLGVGTRPQSQAPAPTRAAKAGMPPFLPHSISHAPPKSSRPRPRRKKR
jgi:hypothetical protein